MQLLDVFIMNKRNPSPGLFWILINPHLNFKVFPFQCGLLTSEEVQGEKGKLFQLFIQYEVGFY